MKKSNIRSKKYKVDPVFGEAMAYTKTPRRFFENTGLNTTNVASTRLEFSIAPDPNLAPIVNPLMMMIELLPFNPLFDLSFQVSTQFYPFL